MQRLYGGMAYDDDCRDVACNVSTTIVSVILAKTKRVKVVNDMIAARIASGNRK
jgi:hypothetical protein